MPTTNPVPSSDPSDLVFNAEKLDEAVNSAAPTFSDRFGIPRRTLASLEAEFPGAQAAMVAAAGSASVAASQASSANAARVASESARDAAQLSAGVYASTSAGIAAVADGAYFNVPSVESSEFLILYQRSGAGAVEIKRYPSKQAVDSAVSSARVWRKLPTHEKPLENANVASANGNMILVHPLPAASRLRVTLRGGDAGGAHSIRRWTLTESTSTWVLVDTLATVTLTPGVDSVVEINTPVLAGQYLGTLGEGIAYVTRSTSQTIRSAGYVLGANAATSFVDSGGIKTSIEPQIVVEYDGADFGVVVEQSLTTSASAKYPARNPVFFAGRKSPLTVGTTAWADRTAVFATPANIGGLLRLSIQGWTQSAVLRVRRYEKSGANFYRRGVDHQFSIVAGQTNVIDTGLYLSQDDYFGVTWPANTVAYASGGTQAPGELWYFGSSLSANDTLPQTAGQLMIRAEVFPDSTVFASPNVVMLGDSLVDDYAISNHYANFTGESVLNGGIGGSRLVYSGANANYTALSVSAIAQSISTGNFSAAVSAAAVTGDTARIAALQAVDWSRVRRVLVFAGTNDFAAGIALGSEQSADNTNIRGAINYIDAQLKSTYPLLEVYFVSPVWRSRINQGDGLDPDLNANSAGLFLREYVDAITGQAGETKNPALDIYRKSGISKSNAAAFLPDGLHPNASGAERIGRMIGSWVLSMGGLIRE